MLTKTVTILKDREAKWCGITNRHHATVADDSSARIYGLIWPVEVWEEMGRPETITITVEPGNKLND